jgi:hypothetical protein
MKIALQTKGRQLHSPFWLKKIRPPPSMDGRPPPDGTELVKTPDADRWMRTDRETLWRSRSHANGEPAHSHTVGKPDRYEGEDKVDCPDEVNGDQQVSRIVTASKFPCTEPGNRRTRRSLQRSEGVPGVYPIENPITIATNTAGMVDTSSKSCRMRPAVSRTSQNSVTATK